jgi:hypothetical protein
MLRARRKDFESAVQNTKDAAHAGAVPICATAEESAAPRRSPPDRGENGER